MLDLIALYYPCLFYPVSDRKETMSGKQSHELVIVYLPDIFMNAKLNQKEHVKRSHNTPIEMTFRKLVDL